MPEKQGIPPHFPRHGSTVGADRRRIRTVHVVLGGVMATACWATRCDGVSLTGSSLRGMLGLSNIKEGRADQIREDLKSLFPHTPGASYDRNRKFKELVLTLRPPHPIREHRILSPSPLLVMTAVEAVQKIIEEEH